MILVKSSVADAGVPPWKKEKEREKEECIRWKYAGGDVEERIKLLKGLFFHLLITVYLFINFLISP